MERAFYIYIYIYLYIERERESRIKARTVSSRCIFFEKKKRQDSRDMSPPFQNVGSHNSNDCRGKLSSLSLGPM
jgi:hypothetical protein